MNQKNKAFLNERLFNFISFAAPAGFEPATPLAKRPPLAYVHSTKFSPLAISLTALWKRGALTI